MAGCGIAPPGGTGAPTQEHLANAKYAHADKPPVITPVCALIHPPIDVPLAPLRTQRATVSNAKGGATGWCRAVSETVADALSGGIYDRREAVRSRRRDTNG